MAWLTAPRHFSRQTKLFVIHGGKECGNDCEVSLYHWWLVENHNSGDLIDRWAAGWARLRVVLYCPSAYKTVRRGI